MIASFKSGGLPFLLPMLMLSLGVFIVPFAVLAAYSLTAGDAPGRDLLSLEHLAQVARPVTQLQGHERALPEVAHPVDGENGDQCDH